MTLSTMESLTSLFEFKLSSEEVLNAVSSHDVHAELGKVLSVYDFREVHKFTQDIGPGRGLIIMYTNTDGSTAQFRLHPSGLVTFDLMEYVKQGDDPKLKNLDGLKKSIADTLNAEEKVVIGNVRRGGPFNCFFPTTDGKTIEYDFDERVFEEKSEYQDIKIYHSPQFGNMLILDDDPNLAESDLVYTHSITGHDHEDYRDKTVLILGGGDGGILHELLKQQPKFVTMVDIDGIVVEAAKKHLRGICYDSLDQLKGDNYEVIIADCVPILKSYVKEGRQFDYVINDLTAIPVTTEPVGDHWNFLLLILDLSMKVLAGDGKYYTQGNGFNMKSALRMYEAQLAKLEPSVQFKTVSSWVPSYHELWVFYEIWKSVSNGTKQ